MIDDHDPYGCADAACPLCRDHWREEWADKQQQGALEKEHET